jgi:hypothetical protein
MSIINFELASKLKPYAHITINKSRTKAYGSTVYLKNGTSFEIELYNPTQRPFLAKIKVNGSYISQAGIIIKPGQRIFLERFIDDQKKFKFETYEVDGASPEVLKAIENNGDIAVEFYPEKLKTKIDTSWLTTSVGTSTITIPSPSIGNNYWYGSTTTNWNSNDAYFTNTSFGGSTINTISMNVAGSLETGRIEVGEKSNQQLVETFGEFSNFMEAQSIWKILPLSLKPIEAGEIRQYCTGCRTRIKKSSWKFCPTCGEDVTD